MADGRCMMCGGLVEFPEFTSLCNRCDSANMRYANGSWLYRLFVDVKSRLNFSKEGH